MTLMKKTIKLIFLTTAKMYLCVFENVMHLYSDPEIMILLPMFSALRHLTQD